jgi:2-polyprenyl-3-methyl-5-hydroxy-6-metoxy-1,4-benzoquinol methylase
MDRAVAEILPSLDRISESEFHAVVLFETLEHLDWPGDVLDALVKRMVPGGILVVETPDCTGVTNIVSHRDYLLIHPLEHINAFTHETLKAIVERHGFREIKRGPAYVTADRLRLLRREARHLMRRDGRSTQLYFRLD